MLARTAPLFGLVLLAAAQLAAAPGAARGKVPRGFLYDGAVYTVTHKAHGEEDVDGAGQ
jgi:hypothetical protein